MAVPALSVYIHIPFCTVKCSYCGFYSRCALSGEPERYIRQLLRELEVKLKVMNPVKIPSLYIGGGTPTVLSPELFNDLLERIRFILPDPPGEWTVEANPESLTEEHLAVFQRNGVDRISLGIQSFSPRILKILGRRAGPEDIRRAADLLGRCWSGSWNGDLICEVPGQTRQEALEDIRQLSSFNPGHVSLYTLSVEEGSPLEARIRKGELDREGDPETWFAGMELLQTLGWERYEVSNFARPGSESLHNTGYWKMRPYLGAGPSAVSTIPGTSGPIRITNRPDLEGYLAAVSPGDFGDKERISFPEFLMEYLLMGLRLVAGVEKEEIRRVFHLPLEELLPLWTEKGLDTGDLQEREGFWRLSPGGMDFLNPLLLEAQEEIDRRSSLWFPGREGGFPPVKWP